MIRAGRFTAPVVSADGKWAVVSKANGDWYQPRTISRINLQSGAESKINLPLADTLQPIAFLATHNKFLVYRAKGYNLSYRSEETPESGETAAEEISAESEVGGESATEKAVPNPSPKTPEFYLLDANTGITQLIKGEFRPLQQQNFRPLQPTGNPNEFWAAIYDAKSKTTDIGRYNDKTFTFQTVAKLPEISLDSMSIWIDEKEAKIYFAYQGHLLSVPLK